MIVFILANSADPDESSLFAKVHVYWYPKWKRLLSNPWVYAAYKTHNEHLWLSSMLKILLHCKCTYKSKKVVKSQVSHPMEIRFSPFTCIVFPSSSFSSIQYPKASLTFLFLGLWKCHKKKLLCGLDRTHWSHGSYQSKFYKELLGFIMTNGNLFRFILGKIPLWCELPKIKLLLLS